MVSFSPCWLWAQGKIGVGWVHALLKAWQGCSLQVVVLQVMRQGCGMENFYPLFIRQSVMLGVSIHQASDLKCPPHRDLIYWGLTFLSPAENIHLRECLWEWGVVRASEVSCCLAVRNHHPLVGNAGVKGEGIIFSVVLRSSIPCCFRELTTFWNKNVSQMPWLLLGPFMKVKQRLL